MKSPIMYGKLCVSAALALYCSVGHADTYGFIQHDMYNSDWKQYVVQTNPAHNLSWYAQPTGGNNDSWFNISYSHAQSSSAYTHEIAVNSIFRNYGYIPWYFGAVDKISFSFDAKGIRSDFSNAVSAFLRPVIMQDGVVYSVLGDSYATVTVGDWTSYRFDFSASDNWINLATGATPDFSTAGGDITFGVRFGMTVTCTGACNSITAITGFDNFGYSITAVPEPSSYAMLGLGLGLLGFSARRKGQQLK